jgi:hypothetical protein
MSVACAGKMFGRKQFPALGEMFALSPNSELDNAAVSRAAARVKPRDLRSRFIGNLRISGPEGTRDRLREPDRQHREAKKRHG